MIRGPETSVSYTNFPFDVAKATVTEIIPGSSITVDSML